MLLLFNFVISHCLPQRVPPRAMNIRVFAAAAAHSCFFARHANGAAL
jgi:hypothetical protein